MCKPIHPQIAGLGRGAVARGPIDSEMEYRRLYSRGVASGSGGANAKGREGNGGDECAGHHSRTCKETALSVCLRF